MHVSLLLGTPKPKYEPFITHFNILWIEKLHAYNKQKHQDVFNFKLFLFP